MSKDKDKSNKKVSNVLVRVLLLSVLSALLFWSFQQFSSSYHNIELSNKMISALLQEKTGLAREYAKELGLAKESLVQTEAFLKKIQEENDKLREKIKLLDKMSELESTIKRLKEKNALIINQMSSAPKVLISKEKKFATIREGKSIINDYEKKIKRIKKKIKKIKKEERNQRIAAQKEVDRIKLLLGNNGYLIRGGKISPPDMPDPDANLNIKIDVKFVK